MELTWTALFLICGAAGVGCFWYNSLAAREQANIAAMQACEKLRLQFLDGTVAFASLTVARGIEGWINLRRTYIFDYTADSIQRRQGFVILLGARVESVGFAADPEIQATTIARHQLVESYSQQAQPSAIKPLPANVLDFEEWRKRPRTSGSEARKTERGEGNG